MDISKVIPAAVLLASLAFQTRPADPLQEAESLLQKQQYDAAESKLQQMPLKEEC